jgi:hypothetical protein
MSAELEDTINRVCTKVRSYRKLKGLRPQPKHVAPVSVLRQAQ